MLKNFGCVVVAIVLVAGCNSGLEFAPVTGKVTVDGKPLPYKTVVFFPDENTPGSGGGANTDKEGKYTMLATAPGETTTHQGLPQGRYRVMIVEPLVPIQEAQPEAESNDPSDVVIAVAPEMRPRKRDIPPKYTRQETTPLVVEVPAAGGVFDLELSSSGK
jgi:hypothetical protein